MKLGEATYEQVVGLLGKRKEHVPPLKPSDRVKTYGCWIDGIMVGCAASLFEGKNLSRVRLKMLYVHPDFRGRGIAVYLLRYRVVEAINFGAVSGVATCLPPSQKLYSLLDPEIVRTYHSGSTNIRVDLRESLRKLNNHINSYENSNR